jgi:hypothetical protein
MSLECYWKDLKCVPIMIKIWNILQSWILERRRHFDDFKSLLFLFLVTKVGLKIAVKETSGRTFMCCLGVFQSFNFLIILPIFTKICRNVTSLQGTPKPQLQFPIIGNVCVTKAPIIWGCRDSCTNAPHAKDPKLISGKECG